jgi:hypothetical protein
MTSHSHHTHFSGQEAKARKPLSINAMSSTTLFTGLTVLLLLVFLFQVTHGPPRRGLKGVLDPKTVDIKKQASNPLLSCQKGCGPLNPSKIFSFVHIAKCAGASFMGEFTSLVKDVRPKRWGGVDVEQTVAHQRIEFPGDYTLTSFKSPRHHVWSMFSECKYSDWGLRQTNHTAFQRTGNSPRSDVDDFEAWLRHFNTQGRAECFRCYDPRNFQTRMLTETRRSAHCYPEVFSPDIELAKKTLATLDWVGVADFFHESKCMAIHRLLKQSFSDKTFDDRFQKELAPVMRRYLDEECICPKPGKNSVVVFQHHENGRRKYMRNLPNEVLSIISSMTEVDMELYRIVLHQFFSQVAFVESRELDRRFLCDEQLNRVESEMLYLGINVTELYYRILRGEITDVPVAETK